MLDDWTYSDVELFQILYKVVLSSFQLGTMRDKTPGFTISFSVPSARGVYMCVLSGNVIKFT